jgi:hypothetical protein
MKTIKVRFDDDSGCWHIFLVFPDGQEIEVGQFCDEDEAERAANDINRWSQE